MNEDFIELIVDEKKELFEILLRFKFKGTNYIALCPQNADDDSAAIFKIDEADNDEEIFSAIENENLAKEIFVHFISIWELMLDEPQ